jgi:hypothetical protein
MTRRRGPTNVDWVLDIEKKTPTWLDQRLDDKTERPDQRHLGS